MDIISEELLIRVDENDKVLGYETKYKCHQDKGLLHRAFSIFIFNPEKQLLIQKRSSHKPLWPLYWSNSVCSHPRKGETENNAVQRRLIEEIGILTPLQFLFKFQYQATFNQMGSENELCSVYIGITDSPIKANPAEIAEWKYINQDELTKDMKDYPEKYTPWFQIEWQSIRKHYLNDIKSLFNS